MGTNFYIEGGMHVGKRSAAGLYCWDCMVTLCRSGEEGVHYSQSTWADSCPECGKKKVDGPSTADVELGFNQLKDVAQNGVSTCCSFSWAMKPNVFERLNAHIVIDEYNRIYTYQEFKEMLEQCPIHFYQSIGHIFG